MTEILNIVLIIFTIIYILLIIRSIRRKKLNVSYSLFWIITGGILIIALIIPKAIENLSGFLGFETPSNMVFCLTIFIAFYLIFKLTIHISKEHEKNVLLIQEVSMLKDKVKKLEERFNGQKEEN